jgi:deoxyuridine 5'-triphosphate nucleotidohydrolase
VTCELRVAPTCKVAWSIEERLANETRAKNEGRIICSRCSIFVKRAGRTNPNARYRSLDDSLLHTIDTEAKAYLLGWLASDGSVKKNSIALYVHRKDARTLRSLRDSVCPELPIRPKTRTPLVGFTINSRAIASDVCRWLKIAPGRKSKTVRFPELATDDLRWAFLRGFFDGDGSISSINAAYRRAQKGWPSPRAGLACTSPGMLDDIKRFVAIPAYHHAGGIEWSGVNALDFLGRVYRASSHRLDRKYDLYMDWCCWMPALGGSAQGRHPLFRWAKTHANAVSPSKAAVSDSGFDLTLIEKDRDRGGAVVFYRTGIKIQPAFGWYFDLVPRSSIVKTGYALANSVGVIDRAYTGEIFVPLIKIDPNAPDLPLPARIVQIIPRPIVAVEIVEVSDFDDTVRGAGGFGSTG